MPQTALPAVYDNSSTWAESSPTLDIALANALDLIARQQQQIKQLQAEIIIDSMTGCLNHRGFHQTLSREIDRARRSGQTNAVLILYDLDGLKQINDTHGHAAGDAYIQALSAGLRSVRSTDYVGRLGGDEFALLMVDADPYAALARAEQLTTHINSTDLQLDQQTIPMAVSHGAVFVTPDSRADELMAAADKQLYACKALRKNAV